MQTLEPVHFHARLVNNTGTSFFSPMTVAGSMEVVIDRTTSSATSATHSLSTLTLGGSTLTVTCGSSIT